MKFLILKKFLSRPLRNRPSLAAARDECDFGNIFSHSVGRRDKIRLFIAVLYSADCGSKSMRVHFLGEADFRREIDDGANRNRVIWAAKTAKIQLVQTNQTSNKISQRFHAVSQLIHAFN